MDFSFEDRESGYWSWSFWSVYYSTIYVFENYGWYLLFAFIVVAIIYQTKLKPHLEDMLEKYRRRRFEREYSAKYHKDPDVFAAHVSAQQSWAEKMQEKYNKESAEHKRKMEEREERKRQELCNKYSSGGHRLGGDKESDDKKQLRPDYNPLMGAGSSTTYRPPRRSPCGGGGCGR